MVYRQLNARLLANAVVELGAWALRRRRRLRVQGQSMSPTLEADDFVLVSDRHIPKPGAIVVAERPGTSTPIIKRVSTISSDAAWLLSDNGAEGTDSRSFGPVDLTSISGVVTLVLNRPFQDEEGFPVPFRRW